MRIFTFILFLLVARFQLSGQSNYVDLKKKLSSADSVFVISYVSKGDSIHGLEYLLKEEDFSSSLLKGKERLDYTQLSQLTQILTRGERITGRMATNRSFKPKNAILIYKNGTLSYIDIYFSCQRIETSKDIKFDDFDIKPDKWRELKQYFTTFKRIDE